MFDTLNRLQEEMTPWQKHNFPNRPEWLPLMGMAEELGELASIADTDDVSEILDAVADIGIYLVDYSNGQNYKLSEIWMDETSTRSNAISLDHVKALQIYLGRLSHSHIKAFQNIRMHEGHEENAREAIGKILLHLDGICTCYLTTLEETISHTWAKVSKRDWQKNRDTAHL